MNNYSFNPCCDNCCKKSKTNFCPVYGTFVSFETGPYAGWSGKPLPIPILPFTYVSPYPATTQGSFVLNNNGSITVLESGIYAADAKIQLASGNYAQWTLQVNGQGQYVPYYNAATNTGGTSVLSITFAVNQGDIVSIGLESSSTIILESQNTPTIALRMVKIANYIC